MDEEQEDDLDIRDIIQDIKGDLKKSAPPSGVDIETLEEDDLQQFILNMAKTLSVEGLGAVQEVRDALRSVPDDAEAIAAFGSLLGSAGRALDTLTKLQLQKEKIVAQKELKEMEIDQKDRSDTSRVLMNREALLARLMNESKDLEEAEKKAKATVIESKPALPSHPPSPEST